MIFDTLNEFNSDLSDKIFIFVNNHNYEYKQVISIIKGYLNEAKRHNIIDNYIIEYKNMKYCIDIFKGLETNKIRLNIKNKLRKEKLNRINNIDKKYIVI